MRRVLLAALLLCACHHGKPPVIVSFTVDNAMPQQGDSINFSYQVTGATSVRIDPLPGPVSESPVAVTPSVGGDYTLQAQNGAGAVQQIITITVVPAFPVSVDLFTAFPGQASAGTDVALSWKVTSAVTLSLSDGSSNPPRDVTGLTGVHVNPTATTVYTLTAQARPNRTPASASAKAVARVVQPVTVSSFTATPSSITQGQPVTLSWDGTATSWAVNDASTTINRGPLKKLVVHPTANTTYTLIASGPFGTLSPAPAVPVTVAAHSAVSLAYTNPADTAPPFKLSGSCSGSSCTMSLIAQSAVSLHGMALNLPLDSTKVTVSGLSVASKLSDATNPAQSIAIGSGPLGNKLIFGAALKGNGTAPGGDVSFAASELLASFTLTVVSAGGSGPVFDGTGLQSYIQSTSGTTSSRNPVAVAVGNLSAN